MEEFRRKTWKFSMIVANTHHGCTDFDQDADI